MVAFSGAAQAARLSEVDYAAAVPARRPPVLKAPVECEVPSVALEEVPNVLEVMLAGRREEHTRNAFGGL